VNTTTRLHLKQPSGWFAAGREVHRAATLLTDGAFKIFVWLCLHAERGSGTLNVSLAAVATISVSVMSRLNVASRN